MPFPPVLRPFPAPIREFRQGHPNGPILFILISFLHFNTVHAFCQVLHRKYLLFCELCAMLLLDSQQLAQRLPQAHAFWFYAFIYFDDKSLIQVPFFAFFCTKPAPKRADSAVFSFHPPIWHSPLFLSLYLVLYII